MPIKLQLIVLALVGPLFATGVRAYDNCDTLRYNNRAYQECVNNAYGANARPSEPSYMKYYRPTQTLPHEQPAEQSEWARQQAEEAQQRALEAEEQERRIQKINQDIDEQIRRAQALGKENNPAECVRVADRAYETSSHSASRKAQALSAAGLCHVLLGEFSQGEAKLLDAVAVVERVEGRSSQWTQKVVRQLATVYKITNRAGEAQTLLAKYSLSQ